MIDLTKQKSTSSAFINKIGIKKNPKNNNLSFEIELTYGVDNMLQAQTLDNVIGGAEASFRSHVENSENKVTIKSTSNNSLWNLELLDDSDVAIFSQMVDILYMSFNTSHVGCFLNLKVKTIQATSQDCVALCEFLSSKVKTRFENPQSTLFSGTQTLPQSNNVVLVGGVEAISGETAVGIKLSEDNNKIIVDDFGTQFVLMKEELFSEINLSNQNFVNFCTEYRNKKGTENPTWKDIVPHIVLNANISEDIVVLSEELINQIFEDEVDNEAAS